MACDLTHHGVYAFILNARKTEILLIEKSIGPYKGLLDLPGGTPEKLETPEQTVIREVMEETGAEVESLFSHIKFDLVVDYIKSDKTHKLNHTGIVYKASLKTDILPDTKSSDTEGCLWFPISDASEHTVALPTLNAIKQFLKNT